MKTSMDNMFGMGRGAIGEPARLLAAWSADSLSLSNEDNVTSWLDLSGNGNVLLAESAPVYFTNQLNGLPGVFFSSSWMDVTLVETWNCPIVILAVIRPSNLEGFYGSASDGSLAAGFASGNAIMVNGGETLVGGATLSVDTPYLIQSDFTGDGSSELYVNDSLNATGAAGSNSATTYNLGSVAGFNYFTGYIFEIQVWSAGGHGDPNIAAEQASLLAKWAVLP